MDGILLKEITKVKGVSSQSNERVFFLRTDQYREISPDDVRE